MLTFIYLTIKKLKIRNSDLSKIVGWTYQIPITRFFLQGEEESPH